MVKKEEDFNWEKWGKAWDKSWKTRKNESIIWTGMLLFLIGVLWYAVSVGLIDLSLVCPGLLIIVGALIILKGIINQIFNV